jgi:hypothetical protein
VSKWPAIEEPELLQRLAMGERQFDRWLRTLAENIPPRPYDATALEHAIGYPWLRPVGSYRLADGEVALLADLSAAERERTLAGFSEASGRVPLIAIGSNAAPEALERKLAHFPAAEDRAVLALTGRLHDFDVGVAAQPTIYGSMPATLFPSPGAAVGATLLWVTSNQFTQLTWTELSYRLGRLRTRFDVEEMETSFDEVLVYVSRFGAFCPEGDPVALGAIPAAGRTAAALTQEQMLDAAAAMALGPEADAEALVRAIYEDLAGTFAKVAGTVRRASLPFASERWTLFQPRRDALTKP